MAKDEVKKKKKTNKPAEPASDRTAADKTVDPASGETAETTQTGRKVVYQVRTKRDEALLEAFITFDYRVVHPKVGLRFVLYAAVFYTIAFAAGPTGFGAISFGIGTLLIVFLLFRKHISLMMTKQDDKDYQNGITYEYDFYENGAVMLRAGEPAIHVKSYKKGVRAFFSDQNFYYLAVHDDDLFILPKSRFTIGEAADFEAFIQGRTGISSRWIPSGVQGILYRVKNFLTKPIVDPSKMPDFSKMGKNKAAEKEEQAANAGETRIKPKALKRREGPAGKNDGGTKGGSPE